MKKLIYSIILILLMGMTSVYEQTAIGQTIIYTYDAAGNRISRIILLTVQSMQKSAKTDTTDLLQEKQISQPSEDKIGDAKVTIYPNPTKGLLLIEMQDITVDIPTVGKLYSLSGTLLLNQPLKTFPATLDLSGYANGIYILVIESGSQSGKWRIIKE